MEPSNVTISPIPNSITPPPSPRPPPARLPSMDFHTLHRRDLQTLCKKNHIRANMTNLAMADALQSLPTVEGLHQLQQPPKSPSPSPATPTTKTYHTRSQSAMRPHKRIKSTDNEEEHKAEPLVEGSNEPLIEPRSSEDVLPVDGELCGEMCVEISDTGIDHTTSEFINLQETKEVSVSHVILENVVGPASVILDSSISPDTIDILAINHQSFPISESIQCHADSINSSSGNLSTKSDICANMTNVAMADALEARPNVEDHNQPQQSLQSPSPTPVTAMSTRKTYHTRSRSITKQAKRMKTTHNQEEEKDVPFIMDTGEPTHQTPASEGVVDLSITPLEEKMELEPVTTRFDVKPDTSSDGHFRLQHCSRGVESEKIEGEESDLQDQEVRTGHERAVGHGQSAVGGRNDGKDLDTAHLIEVFKEPLIEQRSREDVVSIYAEFSDEMVVKIPSEGSCSSSVQGRLEIEVPLEVQDIGGQHSAAILELQDSQEKTDALVSQAENASENPDSNRSPISNDILANKPPVSESIECSPDRLVLAEPLVEHKRREEVEVVPKDAGFYDEIPVEIPANINQISIPSEGFGSLPMQATLEIKSTDRPFSVAEPLTEQRSGEEVVSVDAEFSDEMVVKLPAERSCSSSVKGTLEFETPVKVRNTGDAHNAAILELLNSQEKMEISVSEDDAENQASEIPDSNRPLISRYIECRPDQPVSRAETFIEGSNEPLIEQRSRVEVVPMDTEYSNEIPVEIPANTNQFSLPSKELCSLSMQATLDIKDVGVRVAEPLIQGFNEHLIEQSKEEVVPIEAEFSDKMPVEIPANINQISLHPEGLCSFSMQATLEIEDDVVQHSTAEIVDFQEAKEPSVSQVSLENAEDLATEILDRSILPTVSDIPVTDHHRSPISESIECRPDSIKTPPSDPSTKNRNDTPFPANETIETEEGLCSFSMQATLEIEDDVVQHSTAEIVDFQEAKEPSVSQVSLENAEDLATEILDKSILPTVSDIPVTDHHRSPISESIECRPDSIKTPPSDPSTKNRNDTPSPANETIETEDSMSCDVLKQEFPLGKSEIQEDSLTRNQIPVESKNQQIIEDLEEEMNQSKGEDSLEKLHNLSLRKIRLMYKESKEAKCLIKKEQGCELAESQAEPKVESKVTKNTSDTLSPAHKTSEIEDLISCNVLKQEFVLEKSELEDDMLIRNQMREESENRQICEELDDEKNQSKVESDSLEKLHSCSLRKLKLMYKESKEAKLIKKEQGFQGPKSQAELEENIVKKTHLSSLSLRKLKQILKEKVPKDAPSE